MMDLPALIQTLIIAIFSGLGTAIGNYFAQRGLIKRMDKALEQIKKQKIK